MIYSSRVITFQISSLFIIFPLKMTSRALIVLEDTYKVVKALYTP